MEGYELTNHPWAWRRGVVVGAIALMLALPTSGFARQGGLSQAAHSAKTGTGPTLTPTRTTVQWQAKPPTRTAEQRRSLEAAEARTNRPGPAVAQADTAGSKVFGAEAPDFSSANGKSSGILAGPPSALSIFRDTIIPGTSASAGGNAYVSNTQEPSVGANGKYNFQTGNWYATRTINNGATWQYLDPFAQFGGAPQNFCCDQVALYEPGRNLMFWLLMGVEDPATTGNHLQLNVSDGDDLVSWCTYTLNPASFGEPSTTFLDYNDMAFSNNNLFIANNPFPAAGGNKTAMLRLNLDSLLACVSPANGFYNVSDWFTFKPVQGATDIMHWASVTPISGVGLGAVIRIYSWADNSVTVFFVDRSIPAFMYMARNSGQNCAGPGVTNWCQYADSRVLGGYTARGVLGWSFNAKQDGGHPFPFTRRVVFSEATKTLLATSDYWNSNFAIQFMAWSPNARGHLAATFALGGGTSSPIYPGTGLYVQDDYGPIFNYAGGASNACLSGNSGFYRWGDYLTVRPFYPAGIVWIAVAMRNVAGGPCTFGGYSEVRNKIFGRERDANSYHRWKNT
jgi:hypothetical protein